MDENINISWTGTHPVIPHLNAAIARAEAAEAERDAANERAAVLQADLDAALDALHELRENTLHSRGLRWMRR
jgi:hypothetical protein